MEKYGRARQATDDNMARGALHAGCLRQQTHSKYETLIAFSQQQWLHEQPSFFL